MATIGTAFRIVLVALMVTLGLGGIASADLAPPKLKQPKPPAKKVTKSFGEAASKPVLGLVKGVEASLGELVVTKAVPPKGYTAEGAASAKEALTSLVGLGMTKPPTVTSVSASVVLWYGIVPMGRLDLTFWRNGSQLRLLRIREYAHAGDAWFSDHADPLAPGDPTLNGVVHEVLGAIQAKKWAELPVVVGPDFAIALPAEKQLQRVMKARLHGFRGAIPGSCRRLSIIPWQRLTWTLNEVLAVGRTSAGEPVAFAMGAERQPDGTYLTSKMKVTVAKKKPAAEPKKPPAEPKKPPTEPKKAEK